MSMPDVVEGRAVEWRKVLLFCLLAFALFWIPFFGMLLSGGRMPVAAGSWSRFWHALFGIMGPYSPLIAAVFMGVHFWRVRKDGGISGPAPVMLESEMKEEKRAKLLR